MFSKSINKDPLEASTYTYRGDALYRKRDYKNSLKDYSMAVAILPNAANYAMRAHVHRSLGNFSQAIQDFDSSLEINADAIDLYRFRADCRLSAGDKEGARSDMNLLKKKGGQICANEARIFGIDP